MYLQHQWQGTRGTGWWNQEWTLNHRQKMIWISSLGFGVRSWVKIVEVGHEVSVIQKSLRKTTEVPSRNIEFEPVRKRWTIWPQPLLVQSIFLLAKKNGSVNVRDWSEFLIRTNIVSCSNCSTPPADKNPLVSSSSVRLFTPFKWCFHGHSAKIKRGFVCCGKGRGKQWKSSHAVLRDIILEVDLLCCFRAGCYLSKLHEFGWWIWWIWQIWWDICILDYDVINDEHVFHMIFKISLSWNITNYEVWDFFFEV